MEIKGRGGRKLSGLQARIVYVIAVAMALYHFYFLTVGALDPWLFRGGHLAFALVLIYLITPARKKSESGKNGFTCLDILFAVAAILVYLYLIFNLKGLNMRAGVAPTTFDIIAAVTTIILVLEASRRYFGKVLPIVAGVALLYTFFGDLIPGGIFMTPDYSFERIVSYMFSTTGIYGIALHTSTTYVFLFVLFGAFLVKSGVGDVFMDIAKGLAGGVRGGPAKVSVISSALFGSISGSASSNVVTTGAFTIPLMKKTGYRGDYAAAVETTASIGGLFLPPIMGAGGFLMADILQIPYIEVIKAAIVPALLYYVVLFILVDFEAVKLNLKGIDRSQLPDVKKIILSSGHLLIPIGVLLYILVILNQSPVRAGLWSIATMIIVSWFKKASRIGVKECLNVLSEGSLMALNVSAATATAGIIIGVVQMTGVGLTFSSVIMSLSGTSIIFSLILAMVVSIVLGMGLPITATYITAAAILGPAIVDLGVEPIAAHLFLYFFAAVSGMTPPVAVTAYAAAGVSGENPIKVGFNAMKLGWVAYILPFMFVFGPSLLLIGTAEQIIMSITTAIIGAVAISAAIHGVINRPLAIYERAILLLGGGMLIKVGALSNYIGFGLIVVFLVIHKLLNLRNKTKVE